MAAVFNQKTGHNLFDVSSLIQKWKLGGQRVSELLCEIIYLTAAA